MHKLTAEMNRLNGALGGDSWITDVVAAANSGTGNETELRAPCQSKRSSAETTSTLAMATVVRDEKNNGSILSMSEAEQSTAETELHRQMRVEAACNLIDAVWPPQGITVDDAKNGARNCLSTGHGGVKPGCSSKCAAKKAELLG